MKSNTLRDQLTGICWPENMVPLWMFRRWYFPMRKSLEKSLACEKVSLIPGWVILALENPTGQKTPPKKESQSNPSESPMSQKGPDIWYLGVSENSGFSPQIIHFNRENSILNHPFWGKHPYFWKHPFVWWTLTADPIAMIPMIRHTDVWSNKPGGFRTFSKWLIKTQFSWFN